MAKERTWSGKDGTLFRETEDGGREILSPKKDDGTRTSYTAQPPGKKDDAEEDTTQDS